MRFFLFFLLFFTINTSLLKADEVTGWLKSEIDFILNAYKNDSISNVEKFNLIEETINKNFAGKGIARFVAGNSWENSSKVDKNNYIKLFKKHLALSIASMMQGYSDQEYSLLNSRYDEQSKVSLIDMEIYSDTGKILITWRVKKSKNRLFVIDLLVADISLVVTKRSEFNSMLKNVNYNLKDFNLLLNEQNEFSYNKIIN
tara:strand:+ start:33 stop:635 length:603 start_codon:yes stop_codon:yes gene_type:complete